MIPAGEAHRPALAIFPAKGMLIELPILLGGALEQADLLGVEQPFGQNIAVGVIIPHLLIVQRTFSHDNALAVKVMEFA
jgi:hypothetical protein